MTDSRDLTKVAVAGRMSGNQKTGLGILEDKKWKMTFAFKKPNFRVFSILRHASTQLKMQAPRGMASQHLWTFEIGVFQNEIFISLK